MNAFWDLKKARSIADVKRVHREMTKAIQKRLKTIPSNFVELSDSVCEFWKMPPVPQPQMKAIELKARSSFSGVYFGWEGLFVHYVGKSINIPQRLSNHHAIHRDQMISFIEMDAAQIGRAELFYIWLLDPLDNNYR